MRHRMRITAATKSPYYNHSNRDHDHSGILDQVRSCWIRGKEKIPLELHLGLVPTAAQISGRGTTTG